MWSKCARPVQLCFLLLNHLRVRTVCIAAEGYFMESIDCEFGIVHHKIYIHQKFIRLFVVDTYAKLKPGSNGGLVLDVKYPAINSSADMTFTNPTPYQGGSL